LHPPKKRTKNGRLEVDSAKIGEKGELWKREKRKVQLGTIRKGSETSFVKMVTNRTPQSFLQCNPGGTGGGKILGTGVGGEKGKGGWTAFVRKEKKLVSSREEGT